MTICILSTSSRRLFIDLHRVRSIIFYFYSNEHEPIHVHVKHGECESIFELIMMNGALSNINIREKHGVPPLSTKDKHVAESFIRKYSKNIIDKWVRFFVMAGEKHQHQDKNMSERLYITDAYDVGGLRVRLVFSDGTDVSGRLLAARRDDYTALRFDVPATGTYLIKVGQHPARRIVVIR